MTFWVTPLHKCYWKQQPGT